MSMRATVVFGAALALMSGGALAAAKDSNQSGTVSVGVPSPTMAETVLSAPAVAEKVLQPAKPQDVAEQLPQRAGLAKPIRVYWFLSGR